ncbi:hypothetical protein [Amycolatopsis sp. FDAARGOS 1241]|uniref:hypothetical protein n=1 Tax=Amycolatopsis sp. FDAARGOS 1241 TaxID=2778070 RepID=UPI00194FB9D3|nr:hypothetical protein [Amycolatopsis sp. FDAARGOS 1241]QRP50058.1 hypothetical protein I6J71_21465 [Amycolatopsis sp. FDAARGOS 1241]
MIADQAYSHSAPREAMRPRGISFLSLRRVDRIARRVANGSHGGRPLTFVAEIYTHRNVVERCVNRRTQFSDPATRYANYQAELTLAAIVFRHR